jgi:hypothetical protein
MMKDFVELPLHPSGVYMLVWRGRVVYVGQSINLFSRLARHRTNYENHLKGKRVPASGSPNEYRAIAFDKALVKFCKREELDRLELELIAKHKPELNILLRDRRPIKIDLGKLGFDGEKFREPIIPRPFQPAKHPRLRQPSKIQEYLKTEAAFASPFNQFKPKFRRPNLAA